MATEIKVPQLPESVSDATVAVWHKQPGDAVKRDENLLDLETDKVVLEVPAPADGVLKSHAVEEGDTVEADDLLGTVEEGASADSSSDEESTPKATDEAEADSDSDNDIGTNSKADALSPAVRKLVEENDLDPSDIKGTGKDGRLVKSDVQDYLKQQEEASSSKAKAADSSASSSKSASEGSAKDAAKEGDRDSDSGAVAAAASSGSRGERIEQRVPMTRLRKRIAERLLGATNETAMLTTFNEVDMTAVMKLRESYKERFAAEHGIKLGFMSFFVKASVEGLKKFPAVNASIDGDDILYHSYFDLGIAVSSDRGLVVPILRDADALSFAEVENNISGLGKRARDGKLTMEDLTGGTFSITNGGIFGSMMSTPILNQPQSAILGMHAINERPMVVDGEIKARPMMYLALSYDHRIIDGKEAVQFLVTIKECIEDPARLLLQL